MINYYNEIQNLKNEVRKIKLCSGVGYKVTTLPTGTTLEIKNNLGQPQDEMIYHPWQGIMYNSGSAVCVKTAAATVNGVVPSNFTENYTLSATTYVYVTFNFLTSTSTINYSTSAAPAQPANNSTTFPSTFYINLYNVIKSGDKYSISQFANKNSTVTITRNGVCGDPYYYWSIST